MRRPSRGDWPDWWSDGYASQPYEARLCRQAQRDYARGRAFAGHFGLEIPAESREKVERGIALYTEHTHGHADSLTTPWEGAVKMLAGMKRRSAYDAIEAGEEIIDALEFGRGALAFAPDRPFLYRVINASDKPVRDFVRLYLEGHDYATRDLECVVKDRASGEILPIQKMTAPRGMAWGVWLELQPFETRDLAMEEAMATTSRAVRSCTDFIHYGLMHLPDVVGAEGPSALRATRESLESPHVRISWSKDGEITAWVDQSSGQDLLSRSRNHGAFTPRLRTHPGDSHEQRRSPNHCSRTHRAQSQGGQRGALQRAHPFCRAARRRAALCVGATSPRTRRLQHGAADPDRVEGRAARRCRPPNSQGFSLGSGEHLPLSAFRGGRERDALDR